MWVKWRARVLPIILFFPSVLDLLLCLPMRAYPRCIPCMFNQIGNTLRLVTDDPAVHMEAMRRLAEYVTTLSLDQTPAAVSQRAYAIVSELTGVADPYADNKALTNQAALDILPDIRRAVDTAGDPLDIALHAAVAGNIIDMGIGLHFDIERDVLAMLDRPFAINAIDDLRAELQPGVRIVYLGDNAGEIVFDTLLVEQLLRGGADVILIPEIPFEYDKIAEAVERRDAMGCKCTIIVVAEGASPRDGRQLRHSTASGEHRLGGIGEVVAREIGTRIKHEIRTCVLGHLQRGGAPTTLDRILGTRFGVKATELVAEEKYGSMVSYQNYQVLDVPISHAVHKLRKVPADGEMVRVARTMEISFGD